MSTILYNDDEAVANKFGQDIMSDDDNHSGSKKPIPVTSFAAFPDKFVKVDPIKKNEAPLEETKFTVLLELTGADSKSDRHGVDIVTVLDVSYSMAGKKLEHLKTAMLFLISKLSSIDRLSIIAFSDASERLCPLRKITEDSTKEIGDLVNKLVPIDCTNITAGLEDALKVIKDRKFTAGREAAIMLMSDGEQNVGGDAAMVNVSDVPVYTFGFCAGMAGGYDPELLNTIAKKSKGGTFSIADADDTVASNLSVVFSQCLAGLLTIVVRDLTLKVKQVKSKIEKVTVGNYPQTNDNAEGSVLTVFGNLYIKEKRNVLVDLVLPEVAKEGGNNILEFSFTYNSTDGSFDSGPRFVRVNRVTTTVEPEMMKVITEQTRYETTGIIKQARELAEQNKLQDAKHVLNEAYGSLEDSFDDEANLSFEMLRHELQQLSSFMQSPEIYKTQGRSFALSSETSHNQQRFASRGDAVKLRLFSTPEMDAFLAEAKSFHDNRHN